MDERTPMTVSKIPPRAGKPYDAVLFDFDGVLADTEPLHCDCWAEAVRPLGIRLDWEMYRSIGIGASDRDLAEFLAQRAGPPITSAQLLALHPEKQRLFKDRVLLDPPIPPYIPELINSLSGIKLAVVTSSFRSEIDPILLRAGLRPAFLTLVAGDDVRYLKPSPEPYLLAANRLQVNSPLIVEDSEAGCASGRAAGFDVLRVAGPSEVPAAVRQALLTGRVPA